MYIFYVLKYTENQYVKKIYKFACIWMWPKTWCHYQEMKTAIATIIDEFNFQFTLMLFQYC